MTNQTESITFDILYAKVKTYIKDKKKLETIKKAYNYAYEKHEGQFRKSGEPYIIHPLNVAYILTDIKADYETISSALLHDIIEDSTANKEDIEKEFGNTISSLVYGITKINKINFKCEKEAELAYQRKILVGLADDVRVIIIKLADRLHNLRTLWALKESRQKFNAIETLEILVPIAHRLGMYKIKSELEDLSLRYYKPDVYFGIVESLNKTKLERDTIVNEMLNSVSDLLKKNHIKHEIKGRAKSIYSIYKKMDKGRSFNDIYDLNALRVYVKTEAECYQALGIVHSKYKPMPKRFKDYIAMPKSNMYQSLHTTVFGNNGYLFEIQFRTYEMDEIAENGIASHWSYKEGNKKTIQDVMEQKLSFFKSIIELQEEDDQSFIESVKNDIFENIIYVFTPNGDVIELPAKSTPLDFAYKVHTDIGNKTIGAIVNNNIVPLTYELKTNDIVKINTGNKNVTNREWLNIVKTSQAKKKIQNYFNKIDKDEAIKKGEEILKEELKKQKIAINDFYKDENVAKILNNNKIGSLEELYVNITNNKISLVSILNQETIEKPKLLKLVTNNQSHNIKNDIIVKGIDNIKVNIASCCLPIPDEEILGYITKGNGISIHRSCCPNIRNTSERLIDVAWNDHIEKKYEAKLLITAIKTNNILVEIVSKTSISNILVSNITTLSENERYVITILVENIESLDKFISNLKSIDNIKKIERLMQ